MKRNDGAMKYRMMALEVVIKISLITLFELRYNFDLTGLRGSRPLFILDLYYIGWIFLFVRPT